MALGPPPVRTSPWRRHEVLPRSGGAQRGGSRGIQPPHPRNSSHPDRVQFDKNSTGPVTASEGANGPTGREKTPFGSVPAPLSAGWEHPPTRVRTFQGGD